MSGLIIGGVLLLIAIVILVVIGWMISAIDKATR